MPSHELGFVGLAAIRAGKCDQFRSRFELGIAAIRAGKCDQFRSRFELVIAALF